MQHDLKLDTLINKRQYGFKRGCSTVTALHKTVHRIEKAITTKGYALGTFLDIEGAFDNLPFKAIDNALHNSPLDKQTANWISNMISNRNTNIRLKDQKINIKIRKGCPQGGILSPFLWNLVLNDLLNYTEKNDIGHLQAFADDLLSLITGPDTGTLRDITQKSLKTIEQWCKSRGLNISALKTKMVMFTWNKNWTIKKPITINNTTLTLSTSAKFLGITLDEKLNFKEHITNITKKATAALMQCRKAVGPTWGLSSQTGKWIYTAIIRPILSDGSTIWAKALKIQSNQQKLVKVQTTSTPYSHRGYANNPHYNPKQTHQHTTHNRLLRRRGSYGSSSSQSLW